MLSRRVILIAASAQLAVSAAALPFPAFHPFLAGVLFPAPALLACAVALRAANCAPGRYRLGWLLMSVMLGAWAAVELYFGYYALVLRYEAPFPGPADAFYYAGYAALIGAVATFAFTGRGLVDYRTWADAAAVTIVAAAFWWHFLVEPRFEDGTSLAALVGIGYPILDLAVIVGLVVALYSARDHTNPRMLLLVASVSATIAADAGYSLVGQETVASATVLDLGWQAGYWLLALAAVSPPSRPALVRPLEGQSVAGLLLPYAAVSPLVLFAGYLAWQGQLHLPLAIAAVLAAAFLVLRQWFTLVDNRHLYRQVAANAEELQHALQEQQRLRAEAQHLADHDDLTGLLNRRAWIARAREHASLAVTILDIDHFKAVNDRHGHFAGDEVLCAVAQRLEQLYAGSGVVGRLGGEEFGVLVARPLAEAVALAERAILLFAEDPVCTRRGTVIPVTLSAGVASWQAHAADPLAASHQLADARLFTAKRGGRARVVSAPGLVA
ncbi:MAG: GGDEF domain-containing protein [Dehalococcoidia bacterium]|nr:GGDEF domain-containing protein [Dehalococcoidia bacterium]